MGIPPHHYIACWWSLGPRAMARSHCTCESRGPPGPRARRARGFGKRRGVESSMEGHCDGGGAHMRMAARPTFYRLSGCSTGGARLEAGAHAPWLHHSERVDVLVVRRSFVCSAPRLISLWVSRRCRNCWHPRPTDRPADRLCARARAQAHTLFLRAGERRRAANALSTAAWAHRSGGRFDEAAAAALAAKRLLQDTSSGLHERARAHPCSGAGGGGTLPESAPWVGTRTPAT